MMWTKPYGMKEGFLIGGGLIFAGLMLELSVGPVVWDAFRWPVSGIALAGFLVFVAAAFLLQKKFYGLQFISTYKAAIPAMVYAVALTIIMGLTPQTGREEDSWLNNMLSFWPFVLIYIYMTLILGLVVLRQLKAWKSAKFSLFNFKFSTLSHLGLFIVLTTATLAGADMQRLKMVTMEGTPEWRVLTEQQKVVEMPIAVELKKFIMETYDDGKPRRYASEVQIMTKSGKNMLAKVDVNKPVEVEGWKIYQYGYDTQMGAMSQTSILEFVRDPWLPLVYVGIYMLLAGAALSMLRSIPWRTGWKRARQHPGRSLALVVLVGVAFFCVHHFMPILHSDTLVPALQSPWFKPHIIAYMLAYTMMGAAAAIAVYQLCAGFVQRSAQPEGTFARARFSIFNSQFSIVDVGLALITIGMLFGALWAKEAWGHYWSWDPKETWAAVTWFAYLVYVHYRKLPSHRPRFALWLLLLSFALLQMCWWGINYLPSAQGASVHVYGMPS